MMPSWSCEGVPLGQAFVPAALSTLRLLLEANRAVEQAREAGATRLAPPVHRRRPCAVQRPSSARTQGADRDRQGAVGRAHARSSGSVQTVPLAAVRNRSIEAENGAAGREEGPRKEFRPRVAGNPLISPDSRSKMEGIGGNFRRLGSSRTRHGRARDASLKAPGAWLEANAALSGLARPARTALASRSPSGGQANQLLRPHPHAERLRPLPLLAGLPPIPRHFLHTARPHKCQTQHVNADKRFRTAETSPKCLRNSPYRTLRRNFGMKTT